MRLKKKLALVTVANSKFKNRRRGILLPTYPTENRTEERIFDLLQKLCVLCSWQRVRRGRLAAVSAVHGLARRLYPGPRGPPCGGGFVTLNVELSVELPYLISCHEYTLPVVTRENVYVNILLRFTNSPKVTFTWCNPTRKIHRLVGGRGARAAGGLGPDFGPDGLLRPRPPGGERVGAESNRPGQARSRKSLVVLFQALLWGEPNREFVAFSRYFWL